MLIEAIFSPMDDSQKRIRLLQQQLKELLNRQEAFSKDVKAIQNALEELESEMADKAVEATLEPESDQEPEALTHSHAPASTPEPEELHRPASVEKGPRKSVSKRLYRDRQRKILGGVCAGLSDYIGLNVGIVRLIWILFSALFCIGLLVYLLLWIIIPSAPITGRITEEPAWRVAEEPQSQKEVVADSAATAPEPKRKTASFSLEKYIGENLISKIGIIILIIGVGIGAKYSIENNLISPTVRIVLGYLIGVLLVIFGGRLRKKYENFSAVLVSGAMAILYFITFAAYAFYGMYPQWAAFVLMVLFTVATVANALSYNKQIIAHIGLVGAYCVPFLLSEGNNQPVVLFSYMAIINLGILFIAFRKYWKPLYLFSFAVTWLIFFTWYISSYEQDLHGAVSAVFLLLFFIIFYIAFLAYKFIRKEAFGATDVALLLFNSFIFYGLGYDMIEHIPGGASYLGLFTLLNAFLHALVSFITYRFKLADKNIFHLVTGLVLIFITISIPVQLDGNWVTLLWIGEAALLFRIGRVRNVGLYENLAYPLMVLFFFSLLEDWGQVIHASQIPTVENPYVPFFHVVFLTSLVCSALLGYINFLFYSRPSAAEWLQEKSRERLISFGISGLFLFVLYASFAFEISNYWDQIAAGYSQNAYSGSGEYLAGHSVDVPEVFKGIWLVNYSMFFLILLSLVNQNKLKSRVLGASSLILNAGAWLLFLMVGLFLISELRESYLAQGEMSGSFRIGIRYLSLIVLSVLLLVSHKSLKNGFEDLKPGRVFDIVLALTGCWVATSELLHWLDLSGVSDSYKLWVSILWGIYAVMLIALGIWKKKKHLRIAAIVLFSITLVKLFVYDIAHLNTLSKTVVFVTLGILMLVVSYLYNRFKQLISDDD